MVDINIGKIASPQQLRDKQNSFNQIAQRATNAAISVSTQLSPSQSVQSLNNIDSTSVREDGNNKESQHNPLPLSYEAQFIDNYKMNIGFDDDTGTVYIEIVDNKRQNVIQRLPPESLVDFLQTTNENNQANL